MSKLILSISILFFIFACGGGSSNPVPTPPLESQGAIDSAQGYQVQEKIQAVD